MAQKRLDATAYSIEEGQRYVPYEPEPHPQFTLKAIITGALLGMLFGASNTYLGLKAGLTISTSIPVAVLTVVAFRLIGVFGGRHNILELNMSQTVGSASSSVASGVLFTIPALFMWAAEATNPAIVPALSQMTLLAMAGGLIGVLCMIPLRRYLIAREHGKLPYPEGMACAEVLVAAEHGGKQAANVFRGLAFGMLFKLITGGFKFFGSKLSIALPFKAGIAVSVSPALIGVGYILGIRIATVMVAGGALSALIIIPLINWWGSGLEQPMFPETVKLIRDMSASEIWNRYVRYIGAGAVATGGIITLVKSIPTMLESFRLGLRQIGKGAAEAVERTDRDLSFRTVLIILAIILAVLTLVSGILGYIDSIPVRAMASVLIAIFAFFFVTVSSRIVGLVGVTSNPTSGMTIATLLATSLIFLMLGWTDIYGKATALMVGTAVCIAASIAGDTSQDLKTGFVLGATPRLQQIGELVGVMTSAGVVCWVVQTLHRSVEADGGLGVSPELPAPQSVLMKLVIDGVLDSNLPWALIGIGAGIAIVASLFRIPVLAFAVGVYLPLYTMAAVFCGGFTRWLLTRKQSKQEAERRREQGVLLGSGFVGGEGLTGVVLAIWAVAKGGERITGFPLGMGAVVDGLLAAAAIGAIVWLLAFYARRGGEPA
jgi:putative OPT family oligopeptide transporter